MQRSTTVALSFFAAMLIPAALSWAQSAPANFSQTTYKSGMGQITAMAWAKDGTDDLLFVTQKTGELRVIKGPTTASTLQGANVMTIGVTTASECGLLNVVVDPNYASNKYIYVFASVNGSTQRILRYTITNGATVTSTGPVQIGPDLPCRNVNHDGGGMAIGADGYLYAGVGNLGNGNHVGAYGYADENTSLGSKIIRIDRFTGAAVSSNPWFANGGAQTYMFARGFRNPFGLRMRPGTSQLWLTEVGDGYEQIFIVPAGGDQRWPLENNTNAANGLVPVLAYQTNAHAYGGCITRGAFYNGTMFPQGNGPTGYTNSFFFVDYNSGKVMRGVLNAGNTGFASHSEFVTGNASLTDINVGPDGALYYSSIGGSIYRLAYTAAASQSIVLSTTSLTIAEGGSGTFQVRLGAQPPGNVIVAVTRSAGDTDVTVASGTANLTFTTANWSTNQTVTINAAEDADTSNDSATIQLTLTGATTRTVAVTVTDNDTVNGAPTASITQPANGATVSGTNAEFFGNGTDPQGNGTLARAEFYVDNVLKYTDPYNAATGHFHYGGSHLGWNTTGLSNGPHTLRMVVYDTGGLSGSATVNVTVNNSAGSPGLQGDYYSDMTLTNYTMSRVDPGVNYDWGTGTPDTAIPANGFSVRWTGQVTPTFTEMYTFYVRSDDGARLRVNGTLLLDHWVDQGPTEWSGVIGLTAGVPASIVFEYYENTGGAAAQLSWSSPSQAKGPIPASAMGTVVLTGGPAGGGGGGGGGAVSSKSGDGGWGCGLTGLEGFLILALAARLRARRR